LKKDGKEDSWEYSKVMAVISGDKPIKILEGTEFDDKEETDVNETPTYNQDVSSYDRGKSVLITSLHTSNRLPNNIKSQITVPLDSFLKK